MLRLKDIYHIAIICSDYERSKRFYTEILGLELIQETYQSERGSYKLDLSLNGEYCIELFFIPESPARLSYPEACGLRHLAFAVEDLSVAIQALAEAGIDHEPVRTDQLTGKRFIFFKDPDDLPIELYEA